MFTKENAIDRLNAEGYTLTHTEDGIQHWSRKTKVGAPPCSHNQQRIDVYVKLGDENASMSIHAHNGDCWCSAELEQMSFEYFTRHIRTIEERVVYAWRELRD